MSSPVGKFRQTAFWETAPFSHHRCQNDTAYAPEIAPGDAEWHQAHLAAPDAGKSTRMIEKKKAPRVTRGVKGGMDMGYRVFMLTAHPSVRAANVRLDRDGDFACHITPVDYDKAMQKRFLNIFSREDI